MGRKALLDREGGRPSQAVAKLLRESVGERCNSIFSSMPMVNTTNVRAREGGQDKIKYDGQLSKLEGVVSNDHLFDVYFGECIAPYAALDPLKAVLPVYRPTMSCR